MPLWGMGLALVLEEPETPVPRRLPSGTWLLMAPALARPPRKTQARLAIRTSIDGRVDARRRGHEPAPGRRPPQTLGEAPHTRPAHSRQGPPRLPRIRKILGTPAKPPKATRPGPGRPRGRTTS